MLTVFDEYSRECMAIEISRQLRSDEVLRCLAALFAQHGQPDYIRPHSALGYRPTAAQTLIPSQGALRSAQQELRGTRRQPTERQLYEWQTNVEAGQRPPYFQ